MWTKTQIQDFGWLSFGPMVFQVHGEASRLCHHTLFPVSGCQGSVSQAPSNQFQVLSLRAENHWSSCKRQLLLFTTERMHRAFSLNFFPNSNTLSFNSNSGKKERHVWTCIRNWKKKKIIKSVFFFFLLLHWETSYYQSPRAELIFLARDENFVMVRDAALSYKWPGKQVKPHDTCFSLISASNKDWKMRKALGKIDLSPFPDLCLQRDESWSGSRFDQESALRRDSESRKLFCENFVYIYCIYM